MNAKIETFEDYTTFVSIDPEFYGSETTEERVQEIYARLAGMIQDKFPGICVLPFRDGIDSGRTDGPDDVVVNEINEWISTFWTNAL